MRGLEKQGEGTEKGSEDDVPAIDALPIVLEEAQHVAENGNVESPEETRSHHYSQSLFHELPWTRPL